MITLSAAHFWSEREDADMSGLPVFEVKGDGKSPPCEVCGSTDSIMHTLHPDRPAKLDGLLYERGLHVGKLVERIKKHTDFSHDPKYVLPSADLMSRGYRWECDDG